MHDQRFYKFPSQCSCYFTYFESVEGRLEQVVHLKMYIISAFGSSELLLLRHYGCVGTILTKRVYQLSFIYCL